MIFPTSYLIASDKKVDNHLKLNEHSCLKM